MANWFKSFFSLFSSKSSSSDDEDPLEALYRLQVPDCSQRYAIEYTDTTPTQRFDASPPPTFLEVERRNLGNRPYRALPNPNARIGGWNKTIAQGGYRVTEFVLRGDRRNPREIFEAGGFRPKDICFKPEELDGHDPMVHVTQKGPDGRQVIASLYISFTRSLSVAKSYAKHPTKDTKGWVYLTRVHDAIDFARYVQGVRPQSRVQSQEILAYNAVGWKDILGYRSIDSSFVWTNSQFARGSINELQMSKVLEWMCSGKKV